MRRLILIVLSVFVLMLTQGCRILQDATSSFVISVRGQTKTSTGEIINDAPLPGTRVLGRVRLTTDSTIGNRDNYGLDDNHPQRTDQLGLSKCIDFLGCMTDAYWDVDAVCYNNAALENLLEGLFIHRPNPVPDIVKHHCQFAVIGGFPASSTRFEMVGATPSTITLGALSGNSLSSQYGMPVLYVYDHTGNFMNSINAISANGTSAIFPFPTRSNGTPLPSDSYGFAILNWYTPTQTYCEPMYDDYGYYIGDYCWSDPGDLGVLFDEFLGFRLQYTTHYAVWS